MQIIKTNIITAKDRDTLHFIKNAYITINNSKIDRISQETPNIEYLDLSHLICLPGFIDTHIHLAQNFARGFHSDNLLDWLNNNIFLEEQKTRDNEYTYKLSENFFHNLISNGTTTSVVYTSVFKDTCDIAFQIAEKMGVRSIIGKVMMDCNSPAYLQESTKKSLDESFELFSKWNKKNSLLEYIFTPRFAPVCSKELMNEIGKFAHQQDAFIQTHLSENLGEIAWVNSLFPNCENYTDVYKKYKILSPKTIMAHCIHLNESEWETIKQTETKIAHCPDSNFFLKSGRFPIEKALEKEIDFSVASDVGAGTQFSQFYHMKMENYMQIKEIVSPENAFYDVTIAAAKVISKEKIIGQIKETFEADLQFVSLENFTEKSARQIISEAMYCSDKVQVESTFIAGKKVYQRQ